MELIVQVTLHDSFQLSNYLIQVSLTGGDIEDGNGDDTEVTQGDMLNRIKALRQ
jgi:hypothetical protein